MYKTIKLAPSSAPITEQALAIAIFQGTKRLPDAYRSLDKQMGGVLSQALSRPEFRADGGKLATLYPAKGKVKRLYVLGLGSRSESSADDLRKASGLLLRAAFSGGA
ncbi:MAG: hypothetical protein OER86_05805, partial [Phycisphaerae bacterium]|nr:hypothetical protein [Phycisphaerae bacterium]